MSDSVTKDGYVTVVRSDSGVFVAVDANKNGTLLDQTRTKSDPKDVKLFWNNDGTQLITRGACTITRQADGSPKGFSNAELGNMAIQLADIKCPKTHIR